RGQSSGIPTGPKPGQAPALDPPAGYGSSITQLSGINAKAAQDSGYTAAGVLVAMLDTGFNKAHNATVQLKRVAEYDFVFHDGETANQGNDVAAAWDHGTGTWSVLGGYYPNNLIGPAYNASFLLAKTEDVRTETPIEEDNWMAAVEWADSIGADVISSSPRRPRSARRTPSGPCRRSGTRSRSPRTRPARPTARPTAGEGPTWSPPSTARPWAVPCTPSPST